jgi:hypothetical protein
MKAALLFITVLLVSFSCKKENSIAKKPKCPTSATVRNLTGLLDGCGFVFELADGTRLEPVLLYYCGTPPLPKEVTEDPLYNFVFADGKKVKIGYEKMESVSICMVGQTVKITCITEIENTSK